MEARADEHARMVTVDDDEGEMTLEFLVCGAHGLDEVARVMALDKVCDDLGIGLAG